MHAPQIGQFLQTEIKGRLVQVGPVKRAFIEDCDNIRLGDIDKLKIQDGLPMLAEHATRKILLKHREPFRVL